MSAATRFWPVIALSLAMLAAPLSAVAQPEEDSGGSPPLEGDVEVVALSNRADLVSGGDVLLEVRVPADGSAEGLVVMAGEDDVSDAFAVRDDGRITGTVTGLGVGTTEVTAQLQDGRGATLEVTNHPIGGPIFAGPQVMPWPCGTEENGLGAPADEQCNADTVFSFFYVQADDDGQSLVAYDPDNPPAEEDIATTTTDDGDEVPFIVRRERGVIDRGLYDVAVLFDPAEPWDRHAPQAGWNGKLHWPFGGSCQPYHGQIGPGARPDVGGAPGVLDDPAILGRGFAVATSGFSVLGNNCNTVVSAEATMMIKEHLVETYGDIRYTFGIGGSGGSIQQIQIAGAYPGILDGIIPNSTFADITTTATENLECKLLVHYLQRTSPHLWPAAQHSLIMGHGTAGTCNAWISAYGFPAMLAKPDLGCRTPLLTYQENEVWGVQGLQQEPDWVYHPEDNPAGVRCTIWDYAESVFGTSEDTGFANRPFDNVGVQYGLQALLAGEILPAQFLDLNEKIGGISHDYGYQPERSVAEEDGLVNAYASGQATVGNHLDLVPIIDGSFNPPHGDIHTAFHAFSLHDRIAAANGSADNHVVRQAGGGGNAFALMDTWLANVEADERDLPLEQRVVDNKPEEVQPSGDYFGTNPRIDSGAPLADDVLKCQLKPVAADDYAAMPISFSDAELGRLNAMFPDGVCDWTKPSVGFTETVAWATYREADGPVALGEAPTSVPFVGPQDDPGERIVERLAGPGRVETAVAISMTLPSAETVVIARADAHADALAGGPLAAVLDAPLLLSHQTSLPGVVADEITRLGARQAVLLGGEAALSADVEATLVSLGLAVRRIGGDDRAGTADLIAAEVGTADGVLVASGDGFADAIAAAALGALLSRPVLLAGRDRLPAVTQARAAGVDVIVVGGPEAISDAVVAQLGDVALSVRRVSGADRTLTSVAVAAEALAVVDDAAVVWLATGDTFADALAAAPAVARDRGVLVLTSGTSSAGQAALTWIADRGEAVTTIRIAGGPAAVSPAIEAALSG